MKQLLVVLVVVVSICSAQSKCRGNSKIVAACYSVHGRLSLGADTVRVRLWSVGTRRMLGVTGGPSLDDADDPIWPESLKFNSGGDDIYGDFEVCPFTPERKGEMQMVCIESASHLVVRHQSFSK